MKSRLEIKKEMIEKCAWGYVDKCRAWEKVLENGTKENHEMYKYYLNQYDGQCSMLCVLIESDILDNREGWDRDYIALKTDVENRGKELLKTYFKA